MTKSPWIALLLLAASCSDGDPQTEAEAEPFACALGELTGVWRVTYKEESGDCGPIPDGTVNFSSSNNGASNGCVYAAQEISQDKCRFEFDFTCPLPDDQGKGQLRWVGVTRHTAAGELVGDLTITDDHPTLGCVSTYTVRYRRLLARATLGSASCGDSHRQVKRHAGRNLLQAEGHAARLLPGPLGQVGVVCASEGAGICPARVRVQGTADP